MDVSTYEVTKSSPVELQERTPAEGKPSHAWCPRAVLKYSEGCFAGAIYVNSSAKAYLGGEPYDILCRKGSTYWSSEKLRDSDYDREDTLADIIEEFEFGAKREFDGQEEGSVAVGSRREYDEILGIEEGEMTLSR